MKLPAACPGLSTIQPVDLHRCWADRPLRWTEGRMTQCRRVVDPNDDIGLCPECLEELLP